jgi:hypothetical protein
LSEESFQLSIAKVYQSVGLAPIVTSSCPDGVFAQYTGVKGPRKLRSQKLGSPLMKDEENP